MKNVAVLLCLYHGDHPKWFAQALDSLQEQSYPQERIHIYLGIDGKLPPSLEEVVTQYEKNFYRIYRNEENIGLAKSLNRLIENLEEEEFIFRMDADDLALPGRLASQVAYLEEHPEVDMLGMSIQEVNEDLQPIQIRSYPQDQAAILSAIAKGSPFAHPTICFRSRFFQQIQGYPEHWKQQAGVEDVALWFQALAQGIRGANLPEVGLNFRRSQAFLGRRGLRRAWVELLVYLQGVWRLRGVHPSLLWPLLRFLTRLAPRWLRQFFYNSSLRRRLLNHRES